MIILLCLPLGVLCLVLAVLCLRVRRRRHALACALIGAFFLASAAVMSYGSSVLIQAITRSS